MVSSYAAAALLVAGLVASVSAHDLHARHMNLHNKRDAASASTCGASTTTLYGSPGLLQTTCVTYTTMSTGAGGLVEPTWTSTSSSSSSSSSSTSSSTWVAPTSTSSSSTWEAPTTSSTWVAPTSSEAPPPPPSSTPVAANVNVAAAATSAAPAPSGGSQAPISPNGNKWAFTYTPYNSDGSCKSAGDVASDMAALKGKGFTTVRIYATDCSGPENVGAACRDNGLNMILGIFLDGSGIGSNAYSQVSDLTSWGKDKWDMIEMVVVGNEAIFNGYTDAGSLAGFIQSTRSSFRSAGFTGPVTTTEPLGTIQQNEGTICGAVDVIAANIHPYFNGGILAAGAGVFVASQLQDLAKACNGEKEAYNLETGWPWKGNANSQSIAGTLEQKLAIASISSLAGAKSAMFSFENDGWKTPGPLDVEQYWGCSNLF